MENSTLEYTCALCGMPSYDPLCTSCSDSYERVYGPLDLYDTLISEGMTDDELIALNERAAEILLSMGLDRLGNELK